MSNLQTVQEKRYRQELVLARKVCDKIQKDLCLIPESDEYQVVDLLPWLLKETWKDFGPRVFVSDSCCENKTWKTYLKQAYLSLDFGEKRYAIKGLEGTFHPDLLTDVDPDLIVPFWVEWKSPVTLGIYPSTDVNIKTIQDRSLKFCQNILSQDKKILGLGGLFLIDAYGSKKCVMSYTQCEIPKHGVKL